jgi:hypothetical protein
MSMLLGFAPFAAFAVLDHFAGSLVGLAGAAFLSLAIILRDVLGRKRPPKLLEVSSLVLFGGLAVFTFATRFVWTVVTVRLAVDAGLFLAVVLSLAIGRPFTLVYAKEQTSPEVWTTPGFIRVNVILTSAWAAAFGVMVASDMLMAWVPSVPLTVGVVTTIAALGAAMTFTMKYPERVQRH